MSESILEEAQRLIHGERNKNYGHPRENFSDISALFAAYLEIPITDIDVANLMILVKIARVKGTGYHRDSFTDIAGYAGCVERIYEEPAERVEPLAEWELELIGFAGPRRTRIAVLLNDDDRDTAWRDTDGHAWRWNAEKSEWNYYWMPSGWDTGEWVYATPYRKYGPYTKIDPADVPE
jgi:Domain of unknown function (DUF6378)